MTAPTSTVGLAGLPPGLPPPPARRRRTGPMRAFGVLAVGFAILTIGWACWSLVDVLALRTYHTTASYPLVGRLELHARDADVTLVPDATDRIVVDRTVRRGLRAAPYRADERDGTLVIHDGCNVGMGVACSVSTTIHVPVDLTIVGDLGDGSFTADGITGDVRLDGGDGDIRLRSMSGALTMHTGDGGVEVTGQRAPNVEISSGDGDVDLELAGAPQSVRVSAGDGQVRVCLPHDAPAYAVTTHHGDGSLVDEIASDPRSDHVMVVSAGDGDVALLLC